MQLTPQRGVALFALFAAVGTTADLVSKEIAFSRIPAAGVTVIPGYLQFVKSQNPGAAFGMLMGAFAFFVAISIGALALLSYFSWTAKPQTVPHQLALGLVAAGVIGNLHDRLRWGVVRDFILVGIDYAPVARKLVQWFGTNQWPVFNLADSFICVGAGALLVTFWKAERSPPPKAQPA